MIKSKIEFLLLKYNKVKNHEIRVGLIAYNMLGVANKNIYLDKKIILLPREHEKILQKSHISDFFFLLISTEV